jgi:unsaturated chondroitin disaccharide hydrolase
MTSQPAAAPRVPDARLALALRAIDHTAAALGERFPHITEAGRWKTLDGHDGPRWDGGAWRHGNWTGGFSVGCLWLAAMLSGAARYVASARRWADRLAGREHDDATQAAACCRRRAMRL